MFLRIFSFLFRFFYQYMAMQTTKFQLSLQIFICISLSIQDFLVPLQPFCGKREYCAVYPEKRKRKNAKRMQ